MMFWKKRKNNPEAKDDLQKEERHLKREAAQENNEAANRLREALSRLGPIKDASDMLGS